MMMKYFGLYALSSKNGQAMRLLSGALLLAFHASAAAAEPAAKFLFTHGQVAVTSAQNQTRAASKNAALFAKDKVKTGKAAAAQIRFNDGALLAMRPESEVLIEQSKQDADAKKEKQTTTLIKGGLRAITGGIGKRTPENVSFNTSVATLGIRGTVVNLLMVPQEGLPQFPQMQPGLYVLIEEGQAEIQNGGGAQAVLPGQVFFVSNNNAPAVYAPEFLPVFQSNSNGAVLTIAANSSLQTSPAISVEQARQATPEVAAKQQEEIQKQIIAETPAPEPEPPQPEPAPEVKPEPKPEPEPAPPPRPVPPPPPAPAPAPPPPPPADVFGVLDEGFLLSTPDRFGPASDHAAWTTSTASPRLRFHGASNNTMVEPRELPNVWAADADKFSQHGSFYTRAGTRLYYGEFAENSLSFASNVSQTFPVQFLVSDKPAFTHDYSGAHSTDVHRKLYTLQNNPQGTFATAFASDATGVAAAANVDANESFIRYRGDANTQKISSRLKLTAGSTNYIDVSSAHSSVSAGGFSTINTRAEPPVAQGSGVVKVAFVGSDGSRAAFQAVGSQDGGASHQRYSITGAFAHTHDGKFFDNRSTMRLHARNTLFSDAPPFNATGSVVYLPTGSAAGFSETKLKTGFNRQDISLWRFDSNLWHEYEGSNLAANKASEASYLLSSPKELRDASSLAGVVAFESPHRYSLMRVSELIQVNPSGGAASSTVARVEPVSGANLSSFIMLDQVGPSVSGGNAFVLKVQIAGNNSFKQAFKAEFANVNALSASVPVTLTPMGGSTAAAYSTTGHSITLKMTRSAAGASTGLYDVILGELDLLGTDGQTRYKSLLVFNEETPMKPYHSRNADNGTPNTYETNFLVGETFSGGQNASFNPLSYRNYATKDVPQRLSSAAFHVHSPTSSSNAVKSFAPSNAASMILPTISWGFWEADQVHKRDGQIGLKTTEAASDQALAFVRTRGLNAWKFSNPASIPALTGQHTFSTVQGSVFPKLPAGVVPGAAADKAVQLHLHAANVTVDFKGAGLNPEVQSAQFDMRLAEVGGSTLSSANFDYTSIAGSTPVTVQSMETTGIPLTTTSTTFFQANGHSFKGQMFGTALSTTKPEVLSGVLSLKSNQPQVDTINGVVVVSH